MEFSIYEIETENVNYKRDDDNGEQMVRVKSYIGGSIQEMTLPADEWKKIIKEIPEAIRILTQENIKVTGDDYE